MVADKTFGHWVRNLRSPVLGVIVWLLFARYLFSESNPDFLQFRGREPDQNQ